MQWRRRTLSSLVDHRGPPGRSGLEEKTDTEGQEGLPSHRGG